MYLNYWHLYPSPIWNSTNLSYYNNHTLDNKRLISCSLGQIKHRTELWVGFPVFTFPIAEGLSELAEVLFVLFELLVLVGLSHIKEFLYVD